MVSAQSPAVSSPWHAPELTLKRVFNGLHHDTERLDKRAGAGTKFKVIEAKGTSTVRPESRVYGTGDILFASLPFPRLRRNRRLFALRRRLKPSAGGSVFVRAAAFVALFRLRGLP